MKFLRSLALLLLTLSLTVGCNRSVTLIEKGHAIAQQVPASGAVHPYPGLPIEHEAGPLLVVFLSSTEDLSLLSQKWTHHLYSDLLPCSQSGHGPALYTGTVFEATQRERQERLVASEQTSQKLYKVYIPLDYKRIAAFTAGYGALDVPSYLETSRKDGLCLRLGGGKDFVSLFSNLVPAPLALRETSLVVLGNSATGK